MKGKIINRAITYLAVLFAIGSCVEEKNLYKEKNDVEPYSPYLYSFKDEVQNATAEIVIQANKEIDANNITPEIPYLKFNKSWLLMLTQDDCSHAAYCRTWATINGKSISNSELYPLKTVSRDLYYDAAQLEANDLPPNVIQPNGSLGSTDGVENEVRFSFTTTLAPEANWMNSTTDVKPGYSVHYSRFYRKSGLVWDNVIEMINYGVGIAFHDVETTDVNNPTDILKHYSIAQNIILDKLEDRGCKMLAEPNGNKSYITAALQYPEIQTMVAQSGTVSLYPFKTTDDLKGKLLSRVFDNSNNSSQSIENFKEIIKSQLQKPKTEREAIHIGVHSTDNNWVEFLQWINNTYGKDGDDSVWFPSQEEYYEYNYYRIHGSINIKQVDKNTIKLIIKLPSEKFFYFPSISINLSEIKKEEIVSISSNDVVTGFSYGNYNGKLTMNIDCRKHLYEHAAHFVKQYEKDKSDKSRKSDAYYFVNMLKESAGKNQLLNRIK